MTYDLFTFNGEYDLLEIRFNVLGPFVDKFIIVEGVETFSGNVRPLYWIERDRDRFEEWEDKIEYIIPNYGEDELIMEMMVNRPYVDQLPFKKAFYQKESLRNALEDAQDDDLVIYGDADEVINPDILDSIDDKVYKLR